MILHLNIRDLDFIGGSERLTAPIWEIILAYYIVGVRHHCPDKQPAD